MYGMIENSDKRKEYNSNNSVQSGRVSLLEKRIKELKSIFIQEKDQFLDEDMKARGLK